LKNGFQRLERKKKHRQAATGRRLDICRTSLTLIIESKDLPAKNTTAKSKT
jgi:hypothetical protein